MKRLIENTAMLYIMKFGGYFFSLLTIPYQTRVLSQECFGALSLAISIMFYFQIIIDFGFMITGVTDISKNRDNANRLSRIVTDILSVQFCLAIISLIVMTTLLFTVHNYGEWKNAFYIYFTAVCLEAFLPSFLFRGLENMRLVSIFSLLSKGIAAAFIFIVVRGDEQYLFIPCSRVIGAFVSLIFAWYIIVYKYKIRLTTINFPTMWQTLRKSFGFFLSRIAGLIYNSGNVAILGILYPAQYVAIYSTSEKLVHVGTSAASPIADSLLPHITNTKDYKTAWRLIKLTLPIIIIAAIIVFIYAQNIVVLLFGAEYAESAAILRIMIPIMALTLPSYIIAFPVLVPMGLGKQSNLANIYGSIVFVIGTLTALILGKFNIYVAASMYLLAELTVLSYRCYLVYSYYRDKKTEGIQP